MFQIFNYLEKFRIVANNISLGDIKSELYLQNYEDYLKKKNKNLCIVTCEYQLI